MHISLVNKYNLYVLNMDSVKTEVLKNHEARDSEQYKFFKTQMFNLGTFRTMKIKHLIILTIK